MPETREQCASLGQLRWSRWRQGVRMICIHVLMLCHGGAKCRANFELSASPNVVFISARSDGSASTGISGNRSWEFKGVNVPDGLQMCHWHIGSWKIKALKFNLSDSLPSHCCASARALADMYCNIWTVFRTKPSHLLRWGLACRHMWRWGYVQLTRCCQTPLVALSVAENIINSFYYNIKPWYLNIMDAMQDVSRERHAYIHKLRRDSRVNKRTQQISITTQVQSWRSQSL